jgi:hypothetical protein
MEKAKVAAYGKLHADDDDIDDDVDDDDSDLDDGPVDEI